MSEVSFKEVDKKFFQELIDSTMDSRNSDKLMEVYLDMVAKKLEKDTGIKFRSNYHYSVGNESLDINIDAKDTLDYDTLLDRIENMLGSEGSTSRDEAQLVSDWKSKLELSPYFDTEKHTWKAYDDYSQNVIFDIIYYGLYRKYEKDLRFANELARKYLVENDKWGKPRWYKGHIDELNIDVSFAKNGTMKITSKMPKEFWENIEYLYDVIDPDGKRHSRYY